MNMAIEIVSVPIKNGDFPWLSKRFPEGLRFSDPFSIPSGGPRVIRGFAKRALQWRSSVHSSCNLMDFIGFQ